MTRKRFTPEQIGGALLVLLVVLAAVFASYQMSASGTYAICRVTGFEADGLQVTVFSKDGPFTAVENRLNCACTGKYVFCRFVPGNHRNIQVLTGREVPACLLADTASGRQWKTIPDCATPAAARR